MPFRRRGRKHYRRPLGGLWERSQLLPRSKLQQRGESPRGRKGSPPRQGQIYVPHMGETVSKIGGSPLPPKTKARKNSTTTLPDTKSNGRCRRRLSLSLMARASGLWQLALSDYANSIRPRYKPATTAVYLLVTQTALL